MTTNELLPLTSISRRISVIILRILHHRLIAATELDAHSLLLECYHPSAKLFEPPYFCTYLGTDGFSSYEAEDEANIGERLRKMQAMYCRFRPHQREFEQGGRRVLPRPGDVPGSRTFPGAVQEKYIGATVKQNLSLEAHELFTQLVAQSNLVKIGPRHGFITCSVDMEEGVLRVWKDWLADTAAKGRREHLPILPDPAEQDGKGKEAARENKDESADSDDPNILWVSPAKNSGIRFNVKEKKFRRDAPILIRADEDVPVSFEIEYDGKPRFRPFEASLLTQHTEFLVRTSHLLFTLEKSLVQEDNSSGKAVVFGSFG